MVVSLGGGNADFLTFLEYRGQRCFSSKTKTFDHIYYLFIFNSIVDLHKQSCAEYSALQKWNCFRETTVPLSTAVLRGKYGCVVPRVVWLLLLLSLWSVDGVISVWRLVPLAIYKNLKTSFRKIRHPVDLSAEFDGISFTSDSQFDYSHLQTLRALLWDQNGWPAIKYWNFEDRSTTEYIKSRLACNVELLFLRVTIVFLSRWRIWWQKNQRGWFGSGRSKARVMGVSTLE